MARRTRRFNFVYVPYEEHDDYKQDQNLSLEDAERIKNEIIDYLLEKALSIETG